MKYKNLLIIAVLLVFIGCATTGNQQIAVTNEPQTEQEKAEAFAHWENRKIALKVLECLVWGAVGALSFDYFLRAYPF